MGGWGAQGASQGGPQGLENCPRTVSRQTPPPNLEKKKMPLLSTPYTPYNPYNPPLASGPLFLNFVSRFIIPKIGISSPVGAARARRRGARASVRRGRPRWAAPSRRRPPRAPVHPQVGWGWGGGRAQLVHERVQEQEQEKQEKKEKQQQQQQERQERNTRRGPKRGSLHLSHEKENTKLLTWCVGEKEKEKSLAEEGGGSGGGGGGLERPLVGRGGGERGGGARLTTSGKRVPARRRPQTAVGKRRP